MEQYLQNIRKELEQINGQYRIVIRDRYFSYLNRKENMKLLQPIVHTLKEHAEERQLLCSQQVKEIEKKTVEAVKQRTQLYEELAQDKTKLSKLDEEKIGIYQRIDSLSKSINEDRGNIAKLQQSIAQAKKEKEYWDTVFWATCWIPFVNIGTGCKKGYEEGEYEAKAKVLGEDIERKQNQIGKLTQEIEKVESEQRENQESSGKLANEITAVEGKLAAAAARVNELRSEIALWEPILLTCSELVVELEYTNGKFEVVERCFEKLRKIEESLILPSTDKYIIGCVYKGDRLLVGNRLLQNEYLLSENRRFAAVMQSDNDFVLYCSERPIWASHTCGAQGRGYIEFGADGVVRLKDVNQNWDTKRNGAAMLVLQNDGNLVAYDSDYKSVWASDTYTYANVPGIYFNVH